MTTSGIIECHGRNTGKSMEGANSRLKERKAHNQARPSLWRKQRLKNGGLEYSSQEVKNEWYNAQMGLHTMVNT